MNQDTKPAPFNVGDHVRYVAAQKHDLPTGQGNQTDKVLTAGMEGVILISTGLLSDKASAPNPWRCQVQFANGFQLDSHEKTPLTVRDIAAPEVSLRDVRAVLDHHLSKVDGIRRLRESRLVLSRKP